MCILRNMFIFVDPFSTISNRTCLRLGLTFLCHIARIAFSRHLTHIFILFVMSLRPNLPFASKAHCILFASLLVFPSKRCHISHIQFDNIEISSCTSPTRYIRHALVYQTFRSEMNLSCELYGRNCEKCGCRRIENENSAAKRSLKISKMIWHCTCNIY